MLPEELNAKLVCCPLACAMVREDEPKDELALATAGEYQEAAVASCETVMLWVPTEVPEEAVAVTAELLLEETARAASTPRGSVRFCRSEDRLDAVVWIEVSAVICD